MTDGECTEIQQTRGVKKNALKLNTSLHLISSPYQALSSHVVHKTHYHQQSHHHIISHSAAQSPSTRFSECRRRLHLDRRGAAASVTLPPFHLPSSLFSSSSFSFLFSVLPSMSRFPPIPTPSSNGPLISLSHLIRSTSVTPLLSADCVLPSDI